MVSQFHYVSANTFTKLLSEPNVIKYLFGVGLTTSNFVRKREMRTINCDNTCGEYATVHSETSIHKYTMYTKHGNIIGAVAVMCMSVIVDVIRMQTTI